MTDTCVVGGSLVVIDCAGILITGKPGAGKSMAALNLALKGYGIVSDELVRVCRSVRGSIVGEPFEKPAKIEVRGLGVFILEDLFPNSLLQRSDISLVAELAEFDPCRDLGRIDPQMDEIEILGEAIPRFRVPVANGTQASSLIEILSRFHTCKRK